MEVLESEIVVLLKEVMKVIMAKLAKTIMLTQMTAAIMRTLTTIATVTFNPLMTIIMLEALWISQK